MELIVVVTSLKKVRSTLGFTSRNSIKTALKSMESKNILSSDKIGKHPPSNKLPPEVISNISRIKSYDPEISHCRSDHAAKHLYLRVELTIAEMHRNYTDNTMVKVHYDIYRIHVTDIMNISFCKLGEEICKVCEEYD